MPDYICHYNTHFPQNQRKQGQEWSYYWKISNPKHWHSSIITYYLWSAMFTLHDEIQKLKDLKSAVEAISGDQLKEQSLQSVIRAGWVQSKHVKAPTVNILRKKWGKCLRYWCILVVCIRFLFVMSDLLQKHTTCREMCDQWGLTLRQFTTAAGWSGMAAV